ncbi:MBL fold metallo-hydrolase [Cohnella lubricantis]|uniref:MBL fold metallo-hydrolase n=1 Tax=Cohnella lubricantis TaxID=2163172 RepID=A0A841TB43_9BACL|nr:MBL fold metallo-hydrolase [Cohnella lubricantis]MBB6676470.1 MBL fold metallo-hydrolase [Cohnella lubricantis]MBP2117086.1 phosphoribosyl 1,2-cyclic phosphodiesterase [Cohnella lubricantis]
MITIKSFGSSSAGNCYWISDGRSELLLEAGLRFADIRKALDFRVSRLAGCLISHEHGDHSKSAKDLMKAGVTVYASQGTFDSLKISGHRARPVRSKEQFTVGSWTVMPFDVEHDVDEPIGFLMTNHDGDKLAFLTDTYYCRYTFSGITHLMVECNYSLRILDENIAAGRVHPAMRPRLLRSHFSLENVKDFLRANDLSQLQEIYLLHLSDSNSDEALFKREIQSITGKPVYVAGR